MITEGDIVTQATTDKAYQKSLLAIIKNLQTENQQLKLKVVDLEQDRSHALLALKHAATARSHFLSNMSHELLTPLNTVVGVSDIALANPVLDSDNREAFGHINSAGRLLTAMITDLLGNPSQSGEVTPTEPRTLDRSYMPYGRVLVVDDMQTNLFVAQGLMKPYGLVIDTATSGFACLEKLKAGKEYDVIFMDHMMPDMDGMVTTAALRDLGYTQPVVALTANNIAGQSEVFLSNGFDAFMPKPIDIATLDHVLNTYIRDKQSPQVLADAQAQKEALHLPADTLGVQHRDGFVETTLTALANIEGLAVKTALDAMSNLPDLYLETVQLTLRLLPERVSQMDSTLIRDLASFAIQVHGLKSALRNMGAMALGTQADDLEQAAKSDQQAYCEQHYPDFRQSLSQLIDALQQVLPDEPTTDKQVADPAVLEGLLTTAKAAAQSFDRDGALAALSDTRSFTYGEQVDTLLQATWTALESFDCLGAVSHIETLQEVTIHE